MSDTTAQRPTPTGAASIPAVPNGRRKAVKAASAVPFVGAPATFPGEPSSSPTAAVSAHPHPKENMMATTIDNAAATATDKTLDKAGAMFAGMKDQAKGAMDKGAATVAELNSFGKGNVEALVESGKIAIAGMQTMAQDQAAYVRKQFEEATAAAKTLASVKSPTEFVKLQGDYLRQQFDTMIAETSRSTEAVLKLAGEVVQPLSNRFALAAEKIKQAA